VPLGLNALELGDAAPVLEHAVQPRSDAFYVDLQMNSALKAAVQWRIIPYMLSGARIFGQRVRSTFCATHFAASSP
jgi:hypothetical protein